MRKTSPMIIFPKIAVIAVMFLIFLVAVLAEGYYADITFDIADNGDASIKSITNHPSLAERVAQDFTSKKGKYWLFNVSFPEIFLDYTYTINLPENTVINYVRAPTAVRIGSEQGRTFVKGTGKNTKMSILIQYSVEPVSLSSTKLSPTPWILAAIVLLIIGAYFFSRKTSQRETSHGSSNVKSVRHQRFVRHRRKNYTKKNHAKFTNSEANIPESRAEQGSWYEKELLPDRQRKIVELLEKYNRPVTQKLLEKEMGIPKSSLSRNIDSLAIRGIIKKENKGMTNVLYTNPKKPEL